MSAKLTIIFFILICFEIGALLVLLPWISYPSWSENYLLYMIADRLNWPGLAGAVRSGYVRGAVTGLGVLNILLGVWEVVNFRKTVRAFQVEWQGAELEPRPPGAVAVPDNRPADVTAQER
jgi:hypothetical protein